MSDLPRGDGLADTLDGDDVKVAVIFYSATGNVFQLAQAAADGAAQAGATARLRKVRELAPPETVHANSQWRATSETMREIREASHDDLLWADVVLFGTPTRFGTLASQLKQFIDTTGPIWQQGRLADKVYAGFVSSGTHHGGQESTLLAMSHVFHHWGGIMVPPGYTDPIQFQVGNPYGAGHVAGAGAPTQLELDAVRYLARRAASTAEALKAGRRALNRGLVAR